MAKVVANLAERYMKEPLTLDGESTTPGDLFKILRSLGVPAAAVSLPPSMPYWAEFLRTVRPLTGRVSRGSISFGGSTVPGAETSSVTVTRMSFRRCWTYDPSLGAPPALAPAHSSPVWDGWVGPPQNRWCHDIRILATYRRGWANTLSKEDRDRLEEMDEHRRGEVIRLLDEQALAMLLVC